MTISAWKWKFCYFWEFSLHLSCALSTDQSFEDLFWILFEINYILVTMKVTKHYHSYVWSYVGLFYNNLYNIGQTNDALMKLWYIMLIDLIYHMKHESCYMICTVRFGSYGMWVSFLKTIWKEPYESSKPYDMIWPISKIWAISYGPNNTALKIIENDTEIATELLNFKIVNRLFCFCVGKLWMGITHAYWRHQRNFKIWTKNSNPNSQGIGSSSRYPRIERDSLIQFQ